MKDARELARSEYVLTHWGARGETPDRKLRCADSSELFFTQLGVLRQVQYETRKGVLRPVELFEHDFLRPYPVLCFSPSSRLLLIAGGGYTVTSRGIEG